MEVQRIYQEEPLYTVRPRYLAGALTDGSRGTRAKFTLVSFLKTRKVNALEETSEALRNRLIGPDGQAPSNPYTDFLLTSLSYGFQEKVQLQPLFGDRVAAYAFGAAPVVLQIQGALTDDIDNNWFYKFMILYRDHLRGTRLARNFELAQFTTNNAIFTGVVLGANVQQDSTNDCLVPFSMQFLVRDVTYLPASPDLEQSQEASKEFLTQLLQEGTYSYKQVRDTSRSTLEALQQPFAGSTTSVGTVDNTVTVSFGDETSSASTTVVVLNDVIENDYASDRVAKLNSYQNGSLLGLPNFLKGLSQAAVSDKSKLTAFESFLLKSGGSQAGQTTLSVIGAYGNFVNTLNTDYIGGFGNYVGRIQRNVEAFNRAVGFLGVSELTDTAANVRQQIDNVNKLVSTVKESYQNLKNLKNVFADLKNQFAEIEKSWGNLVGSVSSFNESTSDRLKRSLTSSSADLPAVLGNSALGISKEEAAAILGLSSTTSTDPLAALATGAGQNTSIDDIVASLAARTGESEATAEALLLASFSTKAPDKSIIPSDKPTTISSVGNSAILVF